MSGQRFDFWVKVASFAATGVTLLSAFVAFCMMAANAGAFAIPGLTE